MSGIRAAGAAPTDRGTLCVVVHYGDPTLTQACLRSIAGGTVLPSLVAVVDNAEVPLGPSWIEVPGLTVRLQRPGRNLGFAAGVNRAINDHPGYGTIWLLNNDARVDADALDKLLRTMERFDGEALVSSLVLDDLTGDVWFERACCYPWRLETKHLRVGATDAEVTVDRRRPSWLAVPYMPACSLLVPASMAGDAGLLDEAFFVYGEDIDLSLRATSQGLPLVVARRSIVHHRPSSATGAATRERLNADGLVRVVRRRYPILLPIAILFGTILGVVRTVLDRDRTRVPARLAGYASGLRAPGRGTSR